MDRRTIIGALVVAGLTAAACAGDDGGSAEGAVDAGLREGVQSQFSASSTTSGEPTTAQPESMQEWEALWEAERAAIVQRITENGWGTSADGTTVTGPEGYRVDLSACPDGWSNTEGLTDTEIRIGWPAPLSGPLGDFGNMPRGTAAVLEHDAARGAFTDSEGKRRAVNFIIRDDGYDAARTIPLVDELLDSERVFTLGTMISSGTLATYGKTNSRCVPHFSTTGHPAWADPLHHPWTTGMIVSYSTEAIVWGAYIEQNLDEWGGKVKVAALVMANDFGKAYDSAFRAYVAQSPRSADIEYVTEGLEPSAPIVKDQMTTLAAHEPDVFIGMLTGATCTQTMLEAAENGMKERAKALIVGTGCKASSFVGKDKIGGDGSAADGWWVVGGGLKDFNATEFDDDPWVAATREVLAEAGYDYRASSNFTWGASLGWQISQALQVAGQLRGGLTRSNLNLALRSMDMTNPALVQGVKYNMNGNADAFLIEGADFSQFNSTEQRWEVRNILEVSGASATCSWDQAAGACR